MGDPADVHLAKLGAAESANAAAEGMASGSTSGSTSGSIRRQQPATSATAQLPVTQDLVSSGGSVASKQKTSAAKAGLQDTDADLDELAADSRYINPEASSRGNLGGKTTTGIKSSATSLPSTDSDLDDVAVDPISAESGPGSMSSVKQQPIGGSSLPRRDAELEDQDTEADSSSMATQPKKGLAKAGLPDPDDDPDEPVAGKKGSKSALASTAASSNPAQSKRRFGAGVDPSDLGLQQPRADMSLEEQELDDEATTIPARQIVPGKPAGAASDRKQKQESAGSADKAPGSRPETGKASAVSKALPAVQLEDNLASSRSAAGVLPNKASSSSSQPHSADLSFGSKPDASRAGESPQGIGKSSLEQQLPHPSATSMPVPIVDLPETALREQPQAAHQEVASKLPSAGQPTSPASSSKAQAHSSELPVTSLPHAQPSVTDSHSSTDTDGLDDSAPHLLQATVSNEGHVDADETAPRPLQASVSNEGHTGSEQAPATQLPPSLPSSPEAHNAEAAGTALADALSAAEENERAAQPGHLQGSGSGKGNEDDEVEADIPSLKTGETLVCCVQVVLQGCEVASAEQIWRLGAFAGTSAATCHLKETVVPVPAHSCIFN